MRSNEENLELFADLIEPCAEIFSDKELAAELQRGQIASAVKLGIKKHKSAVIEILARIDGVEVGQYKVPTPPVLAMKIISLFNDPDVAALFTSAGQSGAETASGSVTENTEDGAN